MTPIQNWGAWPSWTPTLTGTTTDPTLGTGATVDGRYQAEGTDVRWRALIVLGANPTGGAGRYQLALPAEYPPASTTAVIGTGLIVDQDDPFRPWVVTVALNAALADELDADPTLPFIFTAERRGPGDISAIGADHPGTWEAGDTIDISGTYEAATS